MASFSIKISVKKYNQQGVTPTLRHGAVVFGTAVVTVVSGDVAESAPAKLQEN